MNTFWKIMQYIAVILWLIFGVAELADWVGLPTHRWGWEAGNLTRVHVLRLESTGEYPGREP